MGFALSLLLLFVALIVVLPIIAIAKAVRARQIAEALEERLTVLENRLERLQRKAETKAAPVEPMPEPITKPIRSVQERQKPNPPSLDEWSTPVFIRPSTRKEPQPQPQPRSQAPTPEPEREPVAPAVEAVEAVKPSSSFDWEQFMGAKLFTWIGGLALFLGVAFFLKYSFDHGFISPELRVAVGFLVGAGLVGGGTVTKRRETAVTAQTLCSTGVLILYGVTFAAHAYYRFEFFGPTTTFLSMAAITAGAFLLSVRLDALVVAILGIAGGFLTPILLSSGANNPLALFGYIALLDAGLLAVALRKRWNCLPILGALGTIMMQVGWASRFFVKEQYYADNSIFIPMAVFAGFQALFLAAVAFGKGWKRLSPSLSFSAAALGATSIIAAFFFLEYPELGQRPLVLLGYLFLIDLGLLALVFLDDLVEATEAVAGIVLFIFLLKWTQAYCAPSTLYPALGFYLLFALFHSVLPILLRRWRGTPLTSWCNTFPTLTLVLILFPIFKLATLSFLLWPVILIVNLLAIGIAVVTATLLPILGVLFLTLVAIGTLIFRIPGDLTGLPFFVSTLGGFSIFFMLASHWAARKITSLFPGSTPPPLANQIPPVAASMPFLLLIMATLKLPVASQTSIFGLALLLVVILLGMARSMSLPKLTAIGLGCAVALETVWYLSHSGHAHSITLLRWYLGFYAVFAVFPFLFRRHFEESVLPWAVAALTGIPHFVLVTLVLTKAFPWVNNNIGILPAAFSIPALISFALLAKRTPIESPARNGQLAWFGGVALFFITLVFPLQFEREWITLGWALEGVALCALFHRVPHPGLRLTGVFLLVTAFTRLALNPAVLSYHVRSASPIFNWYLYTYGIAAICLFAAARLLAPPRNRIRTFNIPPLLQGLGTILLFLLLNIEIANYFTPPNSSGLTFQFSGNLARDMSYTIGWALFAFALLLVGIRKKIPGARFASIGLLLATLLKLFCHDLWQLDQLHRIAAFIIVPIIAMLASFLYQRFLGSRQARD